MMQMSRRLFFWLLISMLWPLAAFGDSGTYIVKKGDTLFKVSRECDVPVSILKSANQIVNTESLAVGQRLTIPEAYVVKKGDTLYSIGRRYGVSADAIMKLNGLSNSQSLRINQKIYIISGETRTVAEPSVSADAKSPVFWPHPGPREVYDGKMRGILISGQKGDLVYSVSKGRVIWAGPYRGFGNVVLVNANDDLVYGYMGIDELTVTVGEEIESGSALGRIGVYFHQTDAKLLFIVYHNLKRLYLDPQEVLNASAKPKG
jgi:LysM repeat protein